MLKKLNMIYQVYQHTESHERYKKNEGEKWICYSAQAV